MKRLTLRRLHVRQPALDRRLTVRRELDPAVKASGVKLRSSELCSPSLDIARST
jgi:hypothetical protein